MRLRKCVSDESGQVVVLAAICLTVLLLGAGIVLDVGGWHADAASLQEGADAAAVSGAEFYVAGSHEPSTSPCLGQTSAVACAQHVATLNHIPLNGTPQLVTTNGNTGIKVNARDTSPINFIARTVGVNPTITATSTASAIAPGSAGNIVPIAVDTDAANQWQAGTQLTLTFDRTTGGNGFVLARNWGCQGTSHAAGCITDGCGCTANVGDTLVQNPANTWQNHQIQDAWGTLVGTTVLAAVYDANLNIVGFASFIVGSVYDDTTITLTFTGKVVPSTSGSGQFFGTASISITQ
jgi:hypothetical protein